MKSIKTKVTLIFCIFLFLVCSVFGISSYLISSKSLVNNVNTQLPELAKQGAYVVDKSLDEQWSSLEVLASNDIIKNPNSTWDEKVRILHTEALRTGDINIAFADKEGNTKGPDGKTDISIKDRPYFQKAINGDRAVSDPIENKTAPGTMIMNFAVPVKYNNEIIGIVFKVRDGNNLSEITNKITFGSSGKAYMINNKGTTIANYDKNLVLKMDNIINNAAQNPKLQPMADVQKRIFEGKTGADSYEYNGDTKYVGYAPVKGADWFLVVTQSKQDALSGLNVLKTSNLYTAIILLLISAVLSMLVLNSVTKPITYITEHLKTIADGDFTKTIPQKLLKIKDESGSLAKSMEHMQNSIRQVIQTVHHETSDVSECVAIEEKSIGELLSQVEDVSATIEELSGGMEETAASTEEMNAASNEIQKAIESIAQKAQEGSNVADEINQRAKALKENAIQSQKTAIEIYKNSQGSLKTAINNSKEVEQINALSEAILEITSQTNLLALNASIEAARAGEAGKGFAVVANEIKNLAENSKKSISEIQRVTKVVVDSVESLSENSMNVLDFIDKKVLDDYATLVKISEQYNSDSVLVDNIVTDLSATTEELSSSIHNMLNSINEITIATNEGAEGTSNIAEKSSTVSNNANDVLQLANKTKESTNKLLDAIKIFKI